MAQTLKNTSRSNNKTSNHVKNIRQRIETKKLSTKETKNNINK